MLGNAVFVLGDHVSSQKTEVLLLQGQRTHTRGQILGSPLQLSADSKRQVQSIMTIDRLKVMAWEKDLLAEVNQMKASVTTGISDKNGLRQKAVGIS